MTLCSCIITILMPALHIGSSVVGSSSCCFESVDHLLRFKMSNILSEWYYCYVDLQELLDLQALAESEKLQFLETSALKNVNIEQAFTMLLTDIYSTATRKIFASQGSNEKDLDGSKIELTGDGEGSTQGIWSWSCCGAVTRLLRPKADAKEA